MTCSVMTVSPKIVPAESSEMVFVERERRRFRGTLQTEHLIYQFRLDKYYRHLKRAHHLDERVVNSVALLGVVTNRCAVFT